MSRKRSELDEQKLKSERFAYARFHTDSPDHLTKVARKNERNWPQRPPGPGTGVGGTKEP